jgi:lipopolysaccharide assembly outer membrane protein LptD (OstA)
MVTQFLAFAAIVVGLVTLVHGQQTGPVEFGRVGGSPDARRATTFTGRADRSENTGAVTIYRGNVSIAFADSNLLIQADEVTYTDDSNELSLNGNVRLKLDAPGLPW